MAKKTTSFLHDPRLRVDRPGTFKLKRHRTDLPGKEDKKELKELLDKDREVIADL